MAAGAFGIDRLTVQRSGLEQILFSFVDYLLEREGDGVSARQRVLEDLEATGYSVGRRLTERMVVGRSDLLAKKENVVKFVCVAFWKQIHGKAADRLSRVKADSSHYVIEDSSFSFFKPLATPDGVDVRDVAGKYTMFSKGAIRGCLTALGVAGSVQVDWTTKFPAIRFQLLLNPAAAVEGE